MCSIINACIENNYTKVVVTLKTSLEVISNDDIHRGFMIACDHKDVNIVKFMLNYCHENNNNIDVHKNNDEAFVTVCSVRNTQCKGNIFETAKCIIEYCEKINDRINIHNIFHLIMFSCAYNKNVKLLMYLIQYEERYDNSYIFHTVSEDIVRASCYTENIEFIHYICTYILKHNMKLIFNETHERENTFCVACKSENIEIVKYILELSEKINNKIDIHISTNYVFLDNYKTYEGRYCILKYLFYLNKHNYNTQKYNLCFNYYNIWGKCPDRLIFEHFILKYSDLYFIRKNINIINKIKCEYDYIDISRYIDNETINNIMACKKHVERYIVNNNIICGRCVVVIEYKPNYDIYLTITRDIDII